MGGTLRARPRVCGCGGVRLPVVAAAARPAARRPRGARAHAAAGDDRRRSPAWRRTAPLALPGERSARTASSPGRSGPSRRALRHGPVRRPRRDDQRCAWSTASTSRSCPTDAGRATRSTSALRRASRPRAALGARGVPRLGRLEPPRRDGLAGGLRHRGGLPGRAERPRRGQDDARLPARAVPAGSGRPSLASCRGLPGRGRRSTAAWPTVELELSATPRTPTSPTSPRPTTTRPRAAAGLVRRRYARPTPSTARRCGRHAGGFPGCPLCHNRRSGRAGPG